MRCRAFPSPRIDCSTRTSSRGSPVRCGSSPGAGSMGRSSGPMSMTTQPFPFAWAAASEAWSTPSLILVARSQGTGGGTSARTPRYEGRRASAAPGSLDIH